MPSIRFLMEVEILTADDADTDIAYAAVKDKALEMRATMQMLRLSGAASFYADPEVRLAMKGSFGTHEIDLDRETHSEECKDEDEKPEEKTDE